MLPCRGYVKGRHEGMVVQYGPEAAGAGAINSEAVVGVRTHFAASLCVLGTTTSLANDIFNIQFPF